MKEQVERELFGQAQSSEWRDAPVVAVRGRWRVEKQGGKKMEG